MTVVFCAKGYPGKYKKNINLDKINKLKLSKKNSFFMLEQNILIKNFCLLEEEFLILQY